MARNQAKNHRRQPSTPKDQGKQLQGVKKQQTLRKSSRLHAAENQIKESPLKSNYTQEVLATSSPPVNTTLGGGKATKCLQKEAFTSFQKRKRVQEEQEIGHLSCQTREQPHSKQPQTSPPSCTAEAELNKEEEERKENTNNIIKTADPLEYWTLTKQWPKGFFEHSQDRKDLEQDSWLEDQMANPAGTIQYVEVNGYRIPCPLKKVPTSLSRKQLDSSTNETCDQTNRERKSSPYRSIRYSSLLEGKGSCMYESHLDVTQGSKDLCQHLFNRKQAVPENSLFSDHLFKKTCCNTEDKNEARVLQDIARLIVPSVETLATYINGATHLNNLIEGVNERWLDSIPVEGPRPQPDYSVGFRRSTFTDEQLKKLDPIIGSVWETSFFTATYRMYFPFFTCEIKCGAIALDIADRQNAHSMTIAVRAFIELFRSVKREKELDREILAFSVSHDHRSVRIYGHYPVIQGETTTLYRYPVRTFDFTEQDGREKWTTLKFVQNVYDHYSPKVHKLICSAISDLPAGISFDRSQSASSS